MATEVSADALAEEEGLCGLNLWWEGQTRFFHEVRYLDPWQSVPAVGYMAFLL